MSGRQGEVSEEACRQGRSQSLHITAMRREPRRGTGSKTAPMEGRRGVGGARPEMRQGTVSAVPGKAKPGTDDRGPRWAWAEASIWTERMVSALVSGVKGGKYAFFGAQGLFTLRAAFEQARHSR
jgi:hypothetical protein